MQKSSFPDQELLCDFSWGDMIEDGTHMSIEHRTLPEKLPSRKTAQPHALSLTALPKGNAGFAIEIHALVCLSCARYLHTPMSNLIHQWGVSSIQSRGTCSNRICPVDFSP